MPIISSAKKRMRQEKKRTQVNKRTKVLLKQALKQVRSEPSAKNLALAYSALDTAAKKNLIHANKASRLKSRLRKKHIAKKST